MALVTILVMIAILGLLTGVVGGQAAFSLNAGKQSNQNDVARYVAYGGLQRTLQQLRANPSLPCTYNNPFPGVSDATYHSRVWPNSDPTNSTSSPIGIQIPPSSILVICDATVGNGKKSMAGIIPTVGTGPGSGYGALGGSSLLSQGGLVDAFTSNGAFAKSTLTSVPNSAQVGAVSGLTRLLEKADGTPTSIDGTVASDLVDGDPATVEPGVYELAPTTQLGGETALDAGASLDPPPAITYLGGADVRASAAERVTITPGHYTSLHAEYDGENVLEPGDYFFESNFELFDDSKVILNGPVDIYVDGLLYVTGFATLNGESDPRDCQITVTGDPATNNWLPDSRNWSRSTPLAPGGYWAHAGTGHEGEIWGRVRVPESTFFCSGSVYGDVQADRLTIFGDPTRASGAIHYFSDLGGDGTTITTLGSASYNYESIWVTHYTKPGGA